MRANYHTHTSFCDGKDTPQALVRQAISLGLTTLGFSGHGHLAIDKGSMSLEGTAQYQREIARLRQVYAGKIALYCGVEQDFCAGQVGSGFAYAIGSVHYIPKDGQFFCVDWSAEETARIIAQVYQGDAYAYAQDYYACVGQVIARTGAQIVGHFDLVQKFDEQMPLLEETHPRYRQVVLDALDQLCPARPIFEINTGAMARGYRTTPYPSLWILQELRRRDCPIVIGSDCHNGAYLSYGYDQAVALAQAAGYACQVTLVNGVWTEVGF